MSYRQQAQIVTAFHHFGLKFESFNPPLFFFPFLVLCILLAGVLDLHKVSHSALSITIQ